MIDNNDRIFKFILKAQRNHNEPDIHSFFIDFDGGRAYVEGQLDGLYMKEYYNNGLESEFCGTAIAVANRLEMLGAKYETIDM